MKKGLYLFLFELIVICCVCGCRMPAVVQKVQVDEMLWGTDHQMERQWQPVQKKRPVLALTFDDGPKAGTTDYLLDELKKRNVKVTFFMIGSQIEDQAEIVRRQFDEGHQIGCHTFNHAELTKLDSAGQQQEIDRWYQAVSSIVGDFDYCIRPPYGCVNDHVCAAMHCPVILWSVDTMDWTGKTASDIANYIVSEAKDGDIILLHDIYENSVKGAIMALDELTDRGYTFVTVDELLRSRGIEPENGTVYRKAPGMNK